MVSRACDRLDCRVGCHRTAGSSRRWRLPGQPQERRQGATGGTEDGLAAEYASALEEGNFDVGVVANAPETVTESVVMYSEGNAAAAKKVSKSVGIDKTEAMTADITDLASGAEVIVVIGTDHGPLPGE